MNSIKYVYKYLYISWNQHLTSRCTRKNKQSNRDKGCRHFTRTCEATVDVCRKSTTHRSESTDRWVLLLFTWMPWECNDERDTRHTHMISDTHNTTVDELLDNSEYPTSRSSQNLSEKALAAKSWVWFKFCLSVCYTGSRTWGRDVWIRAFGRNEW